MTESKSDLPKAKQTALGLYLTAMEAHGKWEASPGTVKVLDVRTPEEYIYVGHAEGAVNIPVAFQGYRWNTEKKYFDYDLNKEFVAQVKEWAQPGDMILATCRSGGRSAIAINILAQAGFTNVWNITDGMEGDTDPEGKRTVNGWKNSAPWTYEVNPEQMRLPEQG